MSTFPPCPACQTDIIWRVDGPEGLYLECNGCQRKGPAKTTTAQAESAWLAMPREEEDSALEQLRQQNRDLLARIARLQDFIREAPVGSGVCCCGNDMANHPLEDHSPVDEWDHAVRCILEETNIEHLAVP